MSQNEPKPKQCRITLDQLQKRFMEADLNGDGTLSADEITQLLQNLGYEDTYKGTIRKICRSINKKTKLQDYNKSHQHNSKLQNLQQNLSQSRPNSQHSAIHHNQTPQQKSARKQLQNKNQEEQAVINFEQFAKFFKILDKPIGKIIYKTSLEHSIRIAQICHQINFKNMFHKDKGQKLKLKMLVGQQKSNYNSSFEINLYKEPKKINNQGVFKISISIATISQQKAQYLVNGLKQAYHAIVEMITAQNQEFNNISQVLNFDGQTEGSIAKVIITTTDEDMQQLIRQMLLTADEILQTDLTYLIKVLYQFNFNLSQIKDNKDAVLEDIFVKQCCMKFQYVGSQFLDALKEIALSKNVFQLLRYQKDPFLLMLLGFLSMEKGEFLLKFKNLDREVVSREITNDLIAQMMIVNEFQTENFSFKKVSQIVNGPIYVRAEFESVKINVKIDIKDILKLPYMLQGMARDSDDD